MSDMDLTDEEGGHLQEVRAGELTVVVPSGDTAGQAATRKRVESPEVEGTSECATVRISSFPQ